MPLLLNSKDVNDSNVMPDDLTTQVPAVASKDFSETAHPVDRVVLIGAGEALYSPRDDKEYAVVASLDTSSNRQAFFYNARQEVCLINFNNAFNLNWENVFSQFQDKKLSLVLVGAVAGDFKSVQNLMPFITSLEKYLKENTAVSVNVTKQLILNNNVVRVQNRLVSLGLFGFGNPYLAMNPMLQDSVSVKLANPGFDRFGHVYDMTSVKGRLHAFPRALPLRNCRKHEAEHREMCGERIRPDVLLLTSESCLADVGEQTEFSRYTIQFAQQSKN